MTAEIRFDLLERRLERAVAAAKPDPDLSSAGGGGTYDGMEGRVARLEAHTETLIGSVAEIRSDVRDVRDRLTRVEVLVEQLPGKGFVVGAMVAALALIAGLVAFQQQIQAFVGAN